MQTLPKAAPAATISSTIVILKPPSAGHTALIEGLGFRTVPWFQENGFIAEDSAGGQGVGLASRKNTPPGSKCPVPAAPCFKLGSEIPSSQG